MTESLGLKIAVLHYWWLSNRGGEAVVKALVDLAPAADLFLNVADEALVRATLGSRFRGSIYRTFISRIPGSERHYQKLLPLMPLALEQLDLSEYDLVISSESGPAKGVITRPDAVHICYCHSPMRYVWDMYPTYLRSTRGLVRWLYPWIAHYLRIWDRLSADRVDYFVANSKFVAGRIAKFYRRSSEVIHPPVNVDAFSAHEPRDDFYLCLGQLVPYKRVDLAVQAFNELGLPLVVIGEGEQAAELKRIARGNVRLMGRQPFEVVKDHLQRCRALIFPGVEDFGIVPVEAMAAGAPVIAYAKGGALETVVDGETGLLFREQSADSIKQAVLRVESGELSFEPSTLAAHARRFDQAVFKEKMRAFIDAAMKRSRDEHA